MRGRLLALAETEAENRFRKMDTAVADLLQCQLLSLLRADYPHHSYLGRRFILTLPIR